MCCGDRERIKSRESVHRRRRDKHFSESRKAHATCSFSFISLSHKEREGRRKEGQREESVFSSFFFALLFHNGFIDSSLLSLPLFSLSFLSLSRAAFVCVFARILSTQINFLAAALKAIQSSSS